MRPTVALVGNPNTGKSTLFNGLTGSRQRVGNWPGVTVEVVQGTLLGHPSIQVIDLPGVYALTATSPDEGAAVDFILSRQADLYVNVVDASNLERNLYLTVQLLEAGLKCLLVLNMMDLAERHRLKIDVPELERRLGIPVLPVIAQDARSLDSLKTAVTDLLVINEVAPPLRVATLYSHPLSGQVRPDRKRTSGTAPLRIPYGAELEPVLEGWEATYRTLRADTHLPPRWLALRLLEHDEATLERIAHDPPLLDRLREQERRLVDTLGTELDVVIAERRFAFIEETIARVLTVTETHVSLSERVDRLVLHRIWGYPIFLGILYLVFSLTMVLGGVFIDFFDRLFGLFFVDTPRFLLTRMGAPEWLNGIAIDGIGVGIQTVATFIPVVFFMFFFLAILEDSGYLSRAAFLMDRLMRALGLPGKAFVPLILGFGCTVPAIVATRTLEHRRDRLLTVFMAPLMSCGARLPVYALFAAAFFRDSAGLVIFSLYLVGMALSVGTGLLMRKAVFQGQLSPFVMELSSYHAPRPRHLLLVTWRNLRGFLLKAGQIIVLMVAILGVLNTLRVDGTWEGESEVPTVLTVLGTTAQPLFAPLGVDRDNWPAAVSLFTGLFAKEAVVGTLTTLYRQVGEAEAAGTVALADSHSGEFDFLGTLGSVFTSLGQDLVGFTSGLLDPLGLSVVEESRQEEAALLDSLAAGFGHNPWRAYAYLLFVLLYIPCVAALSAMAKEVGAVWTLVSGVYLALTAWGVSTLFYQITDGHDLGWFLVSLVVLGTLGALFFLVGARWRRRGAPVTPLGPSSAIKRVP